MKKKFLAQFNNIKDVETFMSYLNSINDNEIIYECHYDIQEWEYRYDVFELEES